MVFAHMTTGRRALGRQDIVNQLVPPGIPRAITSRARVVFTTGEAAVAYTRMLVSKLTIIFRAFRAV